MTFEIVKVFKDDASVKAILLYGSYAQNLQDESSDFDLLILANKIPTYEQREQKYDLIGASIVELAQGTRLDDKGWDNSWSPINDTLTLYGKKIEIGYNTVSWANRVITSLIENYQTTSKAFPFRPYTFLGLLETSQILYERNQFIHKLRSKIRPFPKPLKDKILQEFLPILLEAKADLFDYDVRNVGVLAYQFQLFRALDAFLQILFVINDVYDPAFKRIEPYLFQLKILPPGFKEFLEDVLPQFYIKRKKVNRFLEEAISFIQGV